MLHCVNKTDRCTVHWSEAKSCIARLDNLTQATLDNNQKGMMIFMQVNLQEALASVDIHRNNYGGLLLCAFS